jgi:hypothetical protein
MHLFEGRERIGQLEKIRGGYFYLTVTAETVATFPQGKKTRLICTLDSSLRFPCGLNHLGDGNFFVIISGKKLQQLGKSTGDEVDVLLEEDPNPLGVEMPEVLEALLEQDAFLKSQFEKLTLGKKRSVIHALLRIKDLDLQIRRAPELIHSVNQPRSRPA